MKFRTSWFNPTLAAHHWKRCWPVPAVMLGWCLCYYVLSFVNKVGFWSWQAADEQLSYLCAELSSSAYTLPPLLAIGAFVAALLVFRHLHGRSASQFYLTMPLKRRCSWLTGVVSGWLMAVIPMLLTIVIFVCAAAVNGLALAPILRLLVYGLGTWTIVYGLAVISCILAGNAAGALLIYVGLNCALYVLSCCGSEIAGWFITGYAGSPILEKALLWLTPVAELEASISEEAAPLAMTAPLIYLFAGMVVLALSGVLYQVRASENAGETVAFGPVRVLCKVFGALMVCVLGSLLIESCLNLDGGLPFSGVVALVLGCLVIGWFAAAMIIRRSFRVFDRRELTGLAITAAVLLLLLSAGRLDFTGYTAKMPELSQITDAELTCSGTTVEMTPEELLDIHETILEHTDELVPGSSSGIAYTIKLSYTLENSMQLTRSYNLPVGCDWQDGTIYEKLVSILSEPENNLQTWFPGWTDTPDPDSFVYGGVTLYESTFVSNDWAASLTAQQAQTICDAFQQDIEAGNVLPAIMTDAHEDYLYIIQLGYQGAVYAQAVEPSYDGSLIYDLISAELYVTADMTSTLEALEACGISVNSAAAG